MRIYLSFFVLITVGLSAAAQTVSVGVKGGVPLLDTTPGHDESRPYLVGPTIEIKLPANFAIEADALYQRVGNSTGLLFPSTGLSVVTGAPSTFSYASRERGNSWEFPVLGKYYFERRRAAWQPFVASGFAFRTTGYHVDLTQVTVNENGVQSTSGLKTDFRSALEVGAVFGAGLRFHAGRFALAPEFRYTRWGTAENLSRKNAAGLLLGITF